MKVGNIVLLTKEALSCNWIDGIPKNTWLSMGPLKIVEVNNNNLRIIGTKVKRKYYIQKIWVQPLNKFKDRIK